jgi:peptidoglycan/xylan/chitin deacetylase (PgdA/CDA1 family)
MLSKVFYAGLKAAGIPALARLASSGGVILCYHNVVPDDDHAGDLGLHLSVTEFARQLEWLTSRYQVVSLTEIANRIRLGRTLRGTAAVTFDDGYTGVFEHAWPLLRGRHMPATVFVPTSEPRSDAEGFWWDHPVIVMNDSPARRQELIVDLAGDSKQIDEAVLHGTPSGLPLSHRRAPWPVIVHAASEGFDIGVHSATHRNLTRLRDDELEREVVASREALFMCTGVSATTFAYPYGLVDARVRDAVRTAGYRAAVTLEYGLNTPSTDPWMLRRVNIPASIPRLAYEAWTSGLRPGWRR